MAESLLLPVVRGVVGKAADALVQSVTRMWGVDGDRRRLERQLAYVQSLLADAEAKAETDGAVRAWMTALKAAAYEADDVLDDFQYEALRREATSAHRSAASKVLSSVTSRNRLVFRRKASGDLRNVLEKIHELVAEMNTFGLVVRAEAPAPAQLLPRQTHSALDESTEIFGRGDEEEAVVKLLLEQHDRQDLQVLPIVGMGGVGKTTLAKMVYNNCRIQKHFELRMWHCVSEDFEAASVVRSVVELATNSRCDLPDTIELLRRRLQEAVDRRRFLLILDDVWNEEQHRWEDELRPMLCSSIGGSGSVIVISSRSRRVAAIMGTLPPHELGCLSEDDSWELFSKRAFREGEHEQAELVRLGRRISSKCRGLPLALKTMGGLMSSKQRVQEWEHIANCNTNEGKDEVLPILKLSYKHLSPEMKQCFAFCAVFPKDYEMEKDMLIQLWMANGYINEEGTVDLAQKGEFVLNELVWRSFLQDGTSENGCKMHDLMHDLAKDVANECATAEELIQRSKPINDVRHLKICQNEQVDEISKLVRGNINIRTLLTPTWMDKDLAKSKLMASRALRFRGRDTSVVLRQLTHTTHLRYLDLSNSGIVSLPDSICMMYNLQSLRLNDCYQLQCLPRGLRTMRKLIHIYLLGCHRLEGMPPKLSLLHNLRTLTTFIVGTEDGCGIEELEDLGQLGNRLELYNLWKVKCGSKANLHEKHNLNELVLSWDSTKITDGWEFSIHEEEQVLESLVPHDELKLLKVYGYSGITIPQWMRSPQMFRCLRRLVMRNCRFCKDLPIVWLSPSLEHLSLWHMRNLGTLCKNSNLEAEASNTSLQIFPKLKTMELQILPNLERWVENNSTLMFPRLEKLVIRDCNRLASLPVLPVLTVLHLSASKHWNDYAGSSASMRMPLSLLSSLVRLEINMPVDVMIPPDHQQRSQRPLNTLRSLQLDGDDGFVSAFAASKLRLGLRHCFALVEDLHISSCSSIVHWPLKTLQRCFPRLRSLSIRDCSKLAEGHEGVLQLPQLEQLDIQSCGSLLQVPRLPASLKGLMIVDNRRLVALPDGMDGLTSLEWLHIEGCLEMHKFPQGFLQRLPALKYLHISGCPGLQRSCREGGEYFKLISCIPQKHIQATESKIKKFVKKLIPS